MRKYSLEIIVFICGAVVMVLELDGSRILAPYLGTSLIVWTSLIGLILGSLSLGYYAGGILSDKNPSSGLLAWIILAAGVYIGLLVPFKDAFLADLDSLNIGLEAGSVLAALTLFAIPSFLLGMVSPFAVKLKINNLAETGRTAGRLYALSTLGSISGTFLAGFYLIPALGNSNILLLLSLTLVATALLAQFSPARLLASAVAALILLALIFTGSGKSPADKLVDLDTKYNRIWIYDDMDSRTGRPVKIMKFENSAWQSAMFLDDPDTLVFEYLKYFDLAFHFNPSIRDALLIGGAAYSYPKHFIKAYPEASLDVVELDPELTRIAKEFFALPNDPRLNIIHQDGRTYLNKNRKLYDAIFVDAFFSTSIPAHLTTLETANRLNVSLADGGIIVLNLISALTGPKSEFLKAEYSTYREAFPAVAILKVNDYPDDIPQNIILLAGKSGFAAGFSSPNQLFSQYLSRRWNRITASPELVLTDDHAPTEYYSLKMYR